MISTSKSWNFFFCIFLFIPIIIENLSLQLYEVITDVCGIKVTVSEMKEAMAEVDRDRSNNVDFYEYLKIAEMIIKKQG